MKTRSRTCGRPPISRGSRWGLNTAGVDETRYPSWRSVVTIVAQVSCWRGPARLRTFSSRITAGRRASSTLQMLKNSVPRVSAMPRWRPLLEKGWQGKPAARTSCSGTAMRPSVSGTMSPSGRRPQLRS